MLWQVGTNDALAYVPLDEFEADRASIPCAGSRSTRSIVVLVGLQYVDRMEQDDNYGKVRELLRDDRGQGERA